MCCDDKSCLPPKKENFSFGQEKVEEKDSSATIVAIPIAKINVDSVAKTGMKKNYWAPVTEQLKNFGQDNFTTGSMSLWIIFFTGFVGGLLALFTPCVWPIIPMTVSFFLKRNNDKRKGRQEALFYGLSIILIYEVLGLLVTILFGASALNTLSTNAVFNLIFFALLVVFAISFLGFFEITLPASWSTALNQKAENTTGAVSLLLMASTLVIVSFSCTGPIIGTLLVQVSTSGSLLAPAIGMFGFALALSIPFSLFALFPTWLNAMPRSGSWLNTVKVGLAFVELALALKFLSVADLTSGWNILSRNLFISLWIVFALGFGFYMLGFIRFPHDGKGQHITWLRRILAVFAFLIVAYLACGFWGAPLKGISAFLPPVQNKQVFHDYDEGMTFAEKNHLPVFIDFTGYGCVNCRKMEAAVFTNADVVKQMSRFVVIDLYVDDRAKLAKPITVMDNGKSLQLETTGDKWSYLQRVKFGANAQPYYVLLDNNGYPVSKAYAYNEDVGKFLAFLKQGLAVYQKE
jgi:thiol:disulfide interchange protein DsbD